MRTREEQIADVFPGFYAEDAEATVTKGDLRLMLDQAERRAEQRVRAEIGADRIPLPTYQAFCNSAKGLLSGEFTIRCPDTICPECEGTGWEDEDENLKCGECDGDGTLKATTPVPWTTIKDIYRAITEEYAPKAAVDNARENAND